MRIAGLQKSSFVDFPGSPCAVIFTPRCNMNCAYCHNAHILFGSPRLLPEDEVLAFLKKRAGLLTAVTVSGGVITAIDVSIVQYGAGHASTVDPRPDAALSSSA